MRALVTGANGLLGGYLCDQAQRCGHQVLATGRGAGRLPGTVPYIACALDDAVTVGKMIEHADCGIVIHCAAQLAGGTGPSFLRDNLTATLNLAQTAKRQGVHRFLFCSTASVYPGKGPFHEKSPTQASDQYAASKIAAEIALNLLADEDFQVVTLRLAGLHGPPRTEGVVHAMLGAALAGKPIRVHEPATRLSISFLEDVATMLMALWQLPWQQTSATYNMASPDTPTLLQLAQMIVSKSASTSELLCGDGAARNRVLDTAKLSREMDLTAATVPDRIDEALLHWSEKNYPGE